MIGPARPDDVSDESTNYATWKNAANEQIRDFQQSPIYGPVYNKIRPPKNMILFVGDGLSSSTVTGARYLKAANMNKSAGEVVLDWELWPTVSLVHTFSANSTTTESAAAATALFCGTKAVQKVIGLTGVKECCTCKRFDSSQEIKSTLIHAQKNGLSTGIVTTTRITHATPAACYAHSRDRNHEADLLLSPSDFSFVCDDIASQLINNGLDFNVILGGGSRMFYQNVSAVTPKTPGSRKDGRNLFAQWLWEQQKRNRRHKLVFDSEKLKRLDLVEVDYLFGLLAPNHLDYEIRRTDQLSFSELTQIAVQILSRNPKGYLLLVEGGRIDKGHHANQAKYALTETLALEQAVSSAMRRVNLNDTLMVVTADHSHAYGVVGKANRRRNILDLDNSQLARDGYPYLISAYFNGPGASVYEPRRDPSNDRIFRDGYRQQALVPLASATHAADDVPLYAIGPLSQLFHRAVDNTYVAHATMFALCLEQYKKEPHSRNKVFIWFTLMETVAQFIPWIFWLTCIFSLVFCDEPTTNVSLFDVADNIVHPLMWKNAATRKIYSFKRSPLYGHIYNTINPPKNMILFIGDGMGSSTITGARYLKAANMNRSAGDVLLDWELWPTVSLVHTFSADRMTTDSASSATALFCGTKVAQQVIGIAGVKKCCTCRSFDSTQQIQSSLILAQKSGMSTGIVTTTRITHATPAAAYAHTTDRDQESDPKTSVSDSFVCDDIASQLINNGLDFNVILGGGSKMFYQNVSTVTPKTPGSRKDGRNLFEQWLREQKKRNRRHKLVFDSEKLKRLDLAEVDYLFGLLAPNHLDYDIRRKNQLSLSEMTEIAIKILARNSKGYLLLVEGGRIDHAHHGNQAKYALTDTLALERAVGSAARQVDADRTLMVVTADHSHVYGVVGYADRRTHILDVDESQTADDGYPYLISAYFNGPASPVKEPRKDPSTDRIFEDDYRQQALVPLGFATHAADDVPLYAMGPFSELFHQPVDNTYVAYATMFALCLDPYANEPHCTHRSASFNGNIPTYQLLVVLVTQFVQNFAL
ncbi:hypothetical protein PHET_00837 [Paragonimus heterotremus]|uniref:alkaline phosphatase n=1 Tax=Paragonimus heterotremus TaxID=100268 RepID=A0A8J4TP07_9TREM|nr:hypothetical protein PHET_00837 [Paragonimus heterotremus]